MRGLVRSSCRKSRNRRRASHRQGPRYWNLDNDGTLTCVPSNSLRAAERILSGGLRSPVLRVSNAARRTLFRGGTAKPRSPFVMTDFALEHVPIPEPFDSTACDPALRRTLFSLISFKPGHLRHRLSRDEILLGPAERAPSRHFRGASGRASAALDADLKRLPRRCGHSGDRHRSHAARHRHQGGEGGQEDR